MATADTAALPMGEHFTRNTLECTAWCNTCQGFTQHRVDGGRRGPCLDARHVPKVNARGETKKQERRREEREHQARNPGLF